MQRVWVSSPSYEAAINHLVNARKSAGLSQRELAERIGKHKSFVSKVESRERRLDMVEFVAYARGLGVRPSELIDQIDDVLGNTIIF